MWKEPIRVLARTWCLHTLCLLHDVQQWSWSFFIQLSFCTFSSVVFESAFSLYFFREITIFIFFNRINISKPTEPLYILLLTLFRSLMGLLTFLGPLVSFLTLSRPFGGLSSRFFFSRKLVVLLILYRTLVDLLTFFFFKTVLSFTTWIISLTSMS